MKIVHLPDHPEFLDRIAAWQYGEWGYLDPEDSPVKRRDKLRGHLHGTGLPLTLVAVDEGGELLGSADLVHHDLPGRPDLTPWLSCVFVAPEHRRRGVGAALTRRAVEEAAGVAAPTLYLCTWNREGFYRGRGWSTLERFTVRDAVCVIMEIDTRSA